MKVSQISIPRIGGTIPTQSFFTFNFFIGLIIGGLAIAAILKLLEPKKKAIVDSEPPLNLTHQLMMEKLKDSI